MSWKELSPEEEDKLIEKVSKKIVDIGIEYPAVLALWTARPVAYIAGQLGRVYLEPMGFYLQFLPTEYLVLLEKHENLKRIIDRVNELADERDEKKRREKMEKKLRKKSKRDMLSDILSIIKGKQKEN